MPRRTTLTSKANLMTNSATSTRPNGASRPSGGTGFHAWQFFILASLVGATVVVIVSPPGTHPIALIMISAAVIFAGLVGLAISRAVSGFFSSGEEALPISGQTRETLEREKNLVLRSIKELEFDKAMGKVSDADFAAIMARLRARALTLMRDLDHKLDQKLEQKPSKSTPARGAAPSAQSATCRSCGTVNDVDARFCKNCGAKVGGQ
jgi:hypothetical protein